MIKLGVLFVGLVFNFLCKWFDLGMVNGGLFMGLNGLVVKSYGGMDVYGYVSVVNVVIELVCGDFVS